MTNKDINYQNGLNSVWTKNLAKNKQPDGKALLDHLRTVHQHHAGFTEKCASTCRDESGRNSYEWLSEIVPDINGTRVLDLACGSGPLLKILHDRNKNFSTCKTLATSSWQALASKPSSTERSSG